MAGVDSEALTDTCDRHYRAWQALWFAWAEFLCGPIEPAETELALQVVDGHRDLTFEHAGIAARLFNGSGRRRRSLSDCLIAAAAIHDGARLATASLADVCRFATAGLKLV